MTGENYHDRRHRTRCSYTWCVGPDPAQPGQRVGNSAKQSRKQIKCQEFPAPIHFLEFMAEPPQKNHVPKDVPEALRGVKKCVGEQPPHSTAGNELGLEFKEFGK